MITRLDKVTLYVNSQEEAVKFWTEKMGFVKTFEQQIGPNMKWIEVAPKGDKLTTLVLYSKEAMQRMNPAMVAHPTILFATDDIEKDWKTLKDKGVSVTDVKSLPYGKEFKFNDNDGNSYVVRG